MGWGACQALGLCCNISIGLVPIHLHVILGAKGRYFFFRLWWGILSVRMLPLVSLALDLNQLNEWCSKCNCHRVHVPQWPKGLHMPTLDPVIGSYKNPPSNWNLSKVISQWVICHCHQEWVRDKWKMFVVFKSTKFQWMSKKLSFSICG